MSKRPPVIDWSTDFDHLDPRWTENPYPIWDELRQKCPIAHTERFMGAYFATRYDDVRLIAYDTEHFSSRRPVVRETRAPLTPAPPITSDPPEHGPAKKVLTPRLHTRGDQSSRTPHPGRVPRTDRANRSQEEL
jgi:cytochrome P450